MADNEVKDPPKSPWKTPTPPPPPQSPPSPDQSAADVSDSWPALSSLKSPVSDAPTSAAVSPKQTQVQIYVMILEMYVFWVFSCIRFSDLVFL